MQRFKPWLLPVLSVLAAIGVSLWAVLTTRSTILDASVLVSGVIWVWLSARASLWNFPVGLVNSAVASASLYHQSIYADSTLYGLYFLLMAYGWWQWKKGEGTDERLIQNVGRQELGAVVVCSAIVWVAAYFILELIGGYSPVYDGLGFASSLGAQYLLSRKYIENWMGWVIVNSLYTVLYLYRGNMLFVLFSIILLVMSFVGWRSWLEIQRNQQPITNNQRVKIS